VVPHDLLGCAARLDRTDESQRLLGLSVGASLCLVAVSLCLVGGVSVALVADQLDGQEQR
jgi:hypothetical protein